MDIYLEYTIFISTVFPVIPHSYITGAKDELCSLILTEYSLTGKYLLKYYVILLL